MAARFAVAAGIAGTVAVVGGIVGVVAITDAGTHTDEPGTRVSIAKIEIAAPAHPGTVTVKAPDPVASTPAPPETVLPPEPKEVQPKEAQPKTKTPTTVAKGPQDGGGKPLEDAAGNGSQKRPLAPTNPAGSDGGAPKNDKRHVIKAPINFAPSPKHKTHTPPGHDRDAKPHGHQGQPAPGNEDHSKKNDHGAKGHGAGSAPRDHDEDSQTQSRHSSPASRG